MIKSLQKVKVRVKTSHLIITGQYSGKWLTKTIFEFRGEGFRVDNIEYWVLKILALLYSFHYFELNTQYASLKARGQIQYSIFNIWPLILSQDPKPERIIKGSKVIKCETRRLAKQFKTPCSISGPLPCAQTPNHYSIFRGLRSKKVRHRRLAKRFNTPDSISDPWPYAQNPNQH